jgi:ABC-type sugar transport system substrate-binding protein
MPLSRGTKAAVAAAAAAASLLMPAAARAEQKLKPVEKVQGPTYSVPSDACMQMAFHAAQEVKKAGGDQAAQEKAYKDALEKCTPRK